VQLKLQVRIKNTGRKPLNIGLHHFALIMRRFDVDRWSPPEHGGAGARRPYRTRHNGRRVWVVPANPEGAYDDLPPRGNRSFATHWNVSGPLAPKRTFRPIDRKRGAVVFYVPRRRRANRLSGVVGLAYVDGPQITVICPRERWGPRVDAGDF
jgi:hypothetical protein